MPDGIESRRFDGKISCSRYVEAVRRRSVEAANGHKRPNSRVGWPSLGVGEKPTGKPLRACTGILGALRGIPGVLAVGDGLQPHGLEREDDIALLNRGPNSVKILVRALQLVVLQERER